MFGFGGFSDPYLDLADCCVACITELGFELFLIVGFGFVVSWVVWLGFGLRVACLEVWCTVLCFLGDSSFVILGFGGFVRVVGFVEVVVW